MQGHPHQQPAKLRIPRFFGQRPLPCQGGRHPIAGPGEDSMASVTGGLDYDPAVLLHATPQQRIMPGQGMLHRLWVLFPKSRAVLEIREQKSNGAPRKFWQRRPQK
jgi:hypothetical protein